MSTRETANNASLPFGMLYQDSLPVHARGYEPYPESWGYDPSSQVSDLLKMGGETEPTTVSRCADTTGFINTDADDANDDKGKD